MAGKDHCEVWICMLLLSGNVHRSRFQQSQLMSISRCQFPKAIDHSIYFTSTDTRSNDLTKLFIRQKPLSVSNRRQENTSPPLFLQRTANQTYIYEITRVSYHNKLSEWLSKRHLLEPVSVKTSNVRSNTMETKVKEVASIQQDRTGSDW